MLIINCLPEIRSLDGDRKALVYDNYSKLITATETIRRMKANMQPLASTAGTLSPAISHIAGTAEGLVRGRSDGGQGEKKKRKEQVDTVRWVLGAAGRYKKKLGEGEKGRGVVEEDWVRVRRLLDLWDKNEVEGANDVRRACEEVLGSIS